MAAIMNNFWKSLLGKATRAELATTSGATNVAQQNLQELEDHINYASFMLAAGVSNRKPIEDWISEARKTAFCLADQIAMYAIQRSSDYQVYRMKSHIGMPSIDELTRRIQGHKTKGEEKCKMPAATVLSSDSTSQLSDISPFIRDSRSVAPVHPRSRMVDKIKKVKEFLDSARPVLYITGGQWSGKTTLMRDVYTLVKQKMDAAHGERETNPPCCWVDVAKTGGLVGLLKEVLQESKVYSDSIGEFEIMKTVQDTFNKYNHYLIVLDNVQDTGVFHSLKQVLQDSKGIIKGKIICLTRRTDIQEDRNQEVLHLPEVLDEYDSSRLLLTEAFPTFFDGREINLNSTVRYDVLRKAIKWKDEHEKDGSRRLLLKDLEPKVELLNAILSKCHNNYPWNIRSIGALLAGSSLDKWEEIEKRIDGMVIDGTKIHEKRDPPIQLEDARLADATIRHCFLYCLAFPDQTSSSELTGNTKKETSEILGGIPTRKLIRLWTAEGYVQDDSPRHSQEQEAENLLEELIQKKLLVVKKKGFDGEVLKCSVNEHIRPLAQQMCEQQKFCRFVHDVDGVAAAPSPVSSRLMTKCSPISPNIRILGTNNKTLLSDRYRMLAVHGDRGVIEASKALGEDIRLRSLLHFKIAGRIEHYSELRLSFQRTCMLLRTLELEGARLARLPQGIGRLVCLRYLGLRNTQLEDLPPTLENLRHLMCLDIRDTNIAEVADVSGFTEMRHLYLTNSFRSHSVLIRQGLKSLIHLQTLSGAAARQSSGMVPFEREILHLKRLRKLSIKKASSTSSQDICNAINKMVSLKSLTITRECDRDDGQLFDPSPLQIGNNLRKLKLGGPVDRKFCDLGPKMQSITYLYLWDSKLPVDLLSALQDLKSLLLLSLLNASTEEKMSCDNGYHKLKKLSIIKMKKLSECTFGPNAMGNLEELVFAECGNLKNPPPSLDRLGSLREVQLAQMLPDFCKQTGEKLKEKTRVHVQELQKLFQTSNRAATGGGI